MRSKLKVSSRRLVSLLNKASRGRFTIEKLTEYEATQKQRGFERNIRKYKREFKGMESAGQPTEESASKLRSWQEKQKDFINQTGLKRVYLIPLLSLVKKL